MAHIIDNTTLENAKLVIENLLLPERILYSYFPGEPDEIVHALQKIRKMLMIENIYSPLWPEISDTGYTVGLTDEELAIDFQKPLTINEANELMLNHSLREPSWRPAAYSIPQEGFAAMYTEQLGEFQTACKTLQNYSNFARQKYIAFTNTITQGMNGLRRKVLKMAIEAILRIYKFAPTFNPEATYKAVPSKETAQTNKELYGIVDLTYVKNSDGTKVGVIFKDINANDPDTSSYEKAEEIGAIKTLKMIKELAKPGTGSTSAEKQESTDNFLKEMKKLDDNYTLDLEGYTLNGNVSAVIGRQLRGFMTDDVNIEIGINAKASAFNVLYLESNLLRNNIRYIAGEEKLFTDAEIAADEAKSESEKLGLARIYGFLMDVDPARPYISLSVNEIKTRSYDYVYDPLDLVYHRYNHYPQVALSPNKFACIFMQPPENSNRKKGK